MKGCLSQVWLASETRGGHMYLQADSHAHVVEGLVALVRLAFEGKTPGEVADLDMDALLASLGLDKHLTPGRSNGLHSMIKRIRAYAAA